MAEIADELRKLVKDMGPDTEGAKLLMIEMVEDHIRDFLDGCKSEKWEA